ncbi:MAG: geranylgeranyl reductase family protein, partial [Chloroflexota bacterium]
MTPVCDVLVVGAGPAGATAARVAAQAGLDVVLIDRHRFPRDKVCGGLLSLRAQRALGLALPESLIHAAPRGVRLVSELGLEALALDRGPVGHIVSRSEFDHFLVERAIAAGAKFRSEVLIGSLGSAPDGRVLAETTGGSWNAGHVIGADGAFSTTGLLAGIRRGWSEWEHGFGLALDIPTGQDGAGQIGDVVEFHLQPVLCGLGWVFPRRDGVTVGLAGLAVERYQLVAQFERFLRFALNRLHLPRPDRRPRAWYLPAGGRRRRIARGRVLLTGDAAGLVDPLAGEGLHTALTSGRLAAKAIVSSG